MVPASAISFPEVRRLELIEHGFMSQIDICGVLDSCSQAQIREESSATARNYPARPCQPYEAKRIFGGAWVHSATVRSCTRVRPLLPVRTDGVLFARVAGAYSRCPCTEDMILARGKSEGFYGRVSSPLFLSVSRR